MRGALDLEYTGPEGLAACLDKHAGHVLGVVGFGAGPAPAVTHQPALQWVHVPVLHGSAATFEVWTSSHRVWACGHGAIAAFTDGSLLFGSMQIEQPEGVTLEALSRQAYVDLFAFVERQACRNLLRVWNYLPRINEPENGLERYRCFNQGRHAAFVRNGREIDAENVPAASVLGCKSGAVVIYFLAANTPGKAVDNPRQLPAYRYPEQYGPRSPIFARAMLSESGSEQCLIVSGTASIVGHETVHRGDVEQQALETLRNIRTLLEQAYRGDANGGFSARTRLKVYVRNAADVERARKHIDHAFGPGQLTIYLQSDICRTDLLVEIEGCQFRKVER